MPVLPTTFTPSVKPDEGYTVSNKPNVLVNKFNDGYASYAGDGINNNLETFTLNWKNLIWETEGESIYNYLEERGAHKPILYTRDGQTTERRYRCVSWTHKRHDGVYVDISAKFEEIANG